MEAYKLNKDLFNKNLTFDALGIISTMISFNKTYYSFEDITGYSYVNSNYYVKKYLKELVLKGIIIYCKKEKKYIIQDIYKNSY